MKSFSRVLILVLLFAGPSVRAKDDYLRPEILRLLKTIPRTTYLFGSESTATSLRLMNDPKSDELANQPSTIDKENWDLRNFPEHQIYLNRILGILGNLFGENSLVRDKRGSPGILLEIDGFKVHYKADLHVIEATWTPLLIEDAVAFADIIDMLVFTLWEKTGLWPVRDQGMNHVHLSVSAFRNNPVHYRNFWVDQLASQDFWSVIGAELQNGVYVGDLHFVALEIRSYFENVIDPLLRLWQKAPRHLTLEEHADVRFPGKGADQIRIKNEFLAAGLIPTPSQKEIRIQMGAELITGIHAGINNLIYSLRKSAASGIFSSGFIANRLVDTSFFIPEAGLAQTIEFRRIPALSSYEELLLWQIYIARRVEMFREVSHLIPITPTEDGKTKIEKMKFFNNHLLETGLNPELFRPFLMPEYKPIRAYVDPCLVIL